MSRAGTSLFGTGSLDELAIYGGALSAATIQEQFNSNGPEPRPVASFSPRRACRTPGETVTLDGSGSHYANGSIVKYEWDLNGDGTYETNTGSTPTTTTSFANPGTYTVGLRVTDSDGATGTTTKQISVGSFPPVANVTASPNPALTGQTVTLDAGESTDQGTITDYKWDLDNSGTFATDTGTTPTVTTTFQAVGSHTVGVRLTDSQGLTSTKTIDVSVLEQGVSDYEDAVLDTPGLIDYYKLGEPSGPTIADSKGTSNGTISGGTFGLPGAVAEDPTTAIGFNGSSDYGAIPLNLSSTSKLTVEFWLKWNQYANNDALAMEFTPNFNANAGGFLVDPNASEFGGTFGVAIGGIENRNSVFFQRPSAGVWHHYAIVIDTTAPAGSEITPYVDGQPVSFQQEGTGTGQGTFANSTLYLMSRGGSALFGARLARPARDLQPAAERRARSCSTTTPHGTVKPPKAAFTISQNPVRPGQSVTFNASGSSDADGTIVDYRWDLNGDGTYETDTGSNPTLTTSIADGRHIQRRPARDRQPQRERHREPLADGRQPAAGRQSDRHAEPGQHRPERDDRRQRLDRPGRDHRLQVGPRQQRQLRDRHRLHAETDDQLPDAGHAHGRRRSHRRPRPQLARDRHGDRARTGRRRATPKRSRARPA